MSSIFSNLTNTLNLMGGQQSLPAGFIGPQQPPVPGPPSIGSQISDSYTKIADQPGFSNALFKLGTTLMAARENGMGLGQGLVAGQNTYNSEMDRARNIEAAKAQAQLEMQKFMMDNAFKLNTANLEQNKFASTSDLERQKLALENRKFAANPGTPETIQAAQQIMAANPGMSFTDAYLTAKNGFSMNGMGGGGAYNDSNGSPITGEDFLATLNPNRAAQIKAYALGKLAIPTGRLTTPQMNQLTEQQILQYDPAADTVTRKARQATYQDATSGKTSQEFKTLNTLSGHIANLQASGDKLNNGSYPAWNSLANSFGQNFQNKAVLNPYKLDQAVASDEITKLLTGGSGSLSDREGIAKTLSSDASPEDRNATINNAVKTVYDRAVALADKVRIGMGTTTSNLPLIDKQFIDPKTLQMFRDRGLDTSPFGDTSQNAAPNAPTQNSGNINGLPALTPAEAIAVLRSRGHKL